MPRRPEDPLERMTQEPSRDRRLRFMSCLPGFTDRTMWQKLAWKFVYQPLMDRRIKRLRPEDLEPKSGDSWVTLEYKRHMKANGSGKPSRKSQRQ